MQMLTSAARGAFVAWPARALARSLRADGPVYISAGCSDGAMCRLNAGNFCSPAGKQLRINFNDAWSSCHGFIDYRVSHLPKYLLTGN